MEKKRRGILQFVKVGLLAVMAMLFASSNAQAVDFEFHGQYRVVYYMDMGAPTDGAGDNRYATHRFRPLFKASDGPWTGTLQLSYGWKNDAKTKDIGVRLAYMTYTFENGITLVTGRFGIGDKFDNLLFDACCNIPFATAFLGKSGNMKWRVGSAKLEEGQTNNTDVGDVENDDDIDAHIFDIDTVMGNAKVGFSYYTATAGEDSSAGDSSASWYGVRINTTLGAVSINADIMGSSYDIDGFDGSGMGFHIELGMPVGDKTANLKIIYTSGDEDGEGFQDPSALGISTGYWGYTSRLGGAFGGGSDQGSGKSHMFGIGNGGLGLMSIQARIKGKFTENISGSIGVAMYTSNEERNDESDIGTGLTAQGTRKLGGPFSVTGGVDFSTIGQAHPTKAAADAYSITTAWLRLQGKW